MTSLLLHPTGPGASLTRPALPYLDALQRVINVKGLEAHAVDLAATTKAHVLALAAGPHFRGVIGVRERDVYVSADDARASPLLPTTHGSPTKTHNSRRSGPGALVLVKRSASWIKPSGPSSAASRPARSRDTQVQGRQAFRFSGASQRGAIGQARGQAVVHPSRCGTGRASRTPEDLCRRWHRPCKCAHIGTTCPRDQRLTGLFCPGEGPWSLQKT